MSPVIGGIDAECERGRAVGHEIDPQDLRGQQRQHQHLTADVEPESTRQQHAKEHRHHFTDVRGQQVAQELADVGEDRAAFFDGGDDRGEVVVGEHHVGRFLRHVGAGDAHRHADVGLLQRWRIVDAVARHRHDGAGPPQRLNDPQLVFGIDARVDGDFGDRAGAARQRQLLELGPGDGACRRRDAELARDDAPPFAGDRR